ncbi:alpha/beta fold hydrolase [Piscinibacter gummiphilus]|uniref:Alpha/beta fold hydrolase n=1 Tax=Piscinibacter gummiphilus TaxID=946333 RepID=A0ABZ0CUI7_9BURK|nr:alpha/beta fold hydrolase [Piscinibacter gummiphilus]WOB08627.1 alpha/beta fold hydrolase [Piscinibacter gummiphilus]
MDDTTFFLPSADDHRIETWHWPAATAPRGVVQIAHGMAEHPLRYRPLAQALNARGLAVYANAHRGHGPAAQAAGTLGDFGPRGFAAVADDMAHLTRHIHRQHPALPVVLLGHSMGSFAAQLYMLDHAALVSAVSLSGTAALDLLVQGRPPTWRLEDANEGIANPRTPFDWLSRDAAQVDAYIADPLCGFAVTPESRKSMYAACMRTTQPEELARLPKDLPLYLFTGDHDPINRNLDWFDPLAARYRAAGLTDVSTHVFGGGRHETLNETNRDEVIGHLVVWIERAITAR